MKKQRTKLIEQHEYPYCLSLSTHLPIKKHTHLFIDQRNAIQMNERKRRLKIQEMIFNLNRTQKAKVHLLTQSRISSFFRTDKCSQCSSIIVSSAFLWKCESCDSKLCSSCVKKKNVELNNKTSIQIPLCPYCEKLMNQITEHMNFLKVKDDAKEHQIVSFHNNIIEKCISFAEELMTVDILIALAMATQPPEMIELERCDEQLIIVREKQRKILELEEFIDIFPKQQYKSDEIIKANIIRAFHLFKKTIVSNSLKDVTKYENLINGYMEKEFLPQILYANPLVVLPTGGEVRFIVNATNKMKVVVNGEIVKHKVHGNELIIPIGENKKNDMFVDLQLFWDGKQVPIDFEIIYLRNVDVNSQLHQKLTEKMSRKPSKREIIGKNTRIAIVTIEDDDFDEEDYDSSSESYSSSYESEKDDDENCIVFQK